MIERKEGRKKKTARRRSWSAALGGIQRGDEEALNFFCQRKKGCKIIFDQSGTIQQREPIDAFTGFLQCDVKLGDKVGFAVSVDGLIDIGPTEVPERSSCLAIVVSFLVLENVS